MPSHAIFACCMLIVSCSKVATLLLVCCCLYFCCNFGRRVSRDRLSELSDYNCILLSVMSTSCPCIAMSCCCILHIVISLFIQHKNNSFCHVVCLISFDPWCLFAWFFLPCLPCHVYFNSISFVILFAFIMLFMHCSKVCFVMLAVCARNLFSLYLFNRNSVLGCSLYVTWLVFRVLCVYAIVFCC